MVRDITTTHKNKILLTYIVTAIFSLMVVLINSLYAQEDLPSIIEKLFSAPPKSAEQHQASLQLKEIADSGNLQAAYNYGVYLAGLGDSESLVKAREYYELASKSQHPMALHNLALMLHYGQGGEKDIKRALELYQVAASKNLKTAQYDLACIYKDGIIVEQDFIRARELYELSAQQNFPPALHNLGVMYYHGHGQNRDLKTAYEYYSKAAKHGYLLSNYNLGLMYSKGEYVSMNLKNAKEHFLLAAKENYPPALYRLGLLYKELDSDDVKALLHIQKAATLGYPLAKKYLSAL